MNLFLLKILLFAQPSVIEDTCYCHGKYYVKLNHTVIDSFPMHKPQDLKRMEYKELEHFINIKPCK